MSIKVLLIVLFFPYFFLNKVSIFPIFSIVRFLFFLIVYLYTKIDLNGLACLNLLLEFYPFIYYLFCPLVNFVIPPNSNTDMSRVMVNYGEYSPTPHANIIKHLMTDPTGKCKFCFPRPSTLPEANGLLFHSKQRLSW